MKQVIIFGASGHGKVIADIVEKMGGSIAGFIDDDREKWGQEFFGYRILGGIEYVDSIDKEAINVIVGIGDNEGRKKVAGELEKKGLQFEKAIHPSAQIGKNVRIGRGTVVMANAVINADAVVGEHCILNTASSVGHDNVLGDFIHISSGVRLGGNVSVGSSSWIGLGSVVINNVQIGHDTVIGAGSVVIRDVEAAAVYMGHPAKFLRRVEAEPEQIVIYGAGGFGREVAWFFEDLSNRGKKYEVVCFIDDHPIFGGKVLNGIPVLSLDEASRRFSGASVVGGVGVPQLRETIMEAAVRSGFKLGTFVHPTVEISRWVEMGEGTLICAGNILTTNVVLGRHVQINLECTIGNDVTMGDYTTLAPGVHVSGYVYFGRRVYVGTGAVIINGTPERPIFIGDDVVIGAGACVVDHVPAGLVVGGVPARPLNRPVSFREGSEREGIRPIVIRGSGGHAREVAFLVERINSYRPTWNLLGFIDVQDVGQTKYGYQVLGNDSWFDRNSPIDCVIAIGNPGEKRKVYEELSRYHLSFPNLIDPAAVMAKDVVMGVGNIIQGPVRLSVGTKIGNFCLLNGVSSFGHDCSLGDFVSTMPFCTISGHVSIGDDAYCGLGTKVVPSVRIGKGAVVGAAALVLKDVPDLATVWGIPAKEIGHKGPTKMDLP